MPLQLLIRKHLKILKMKPGRQIATDKGKRTLVGYLPSKDGLFRNQQRRGFSSVQTQAQEVFLQEAILLQKVQLQWGPTMKIPVLIVLQTMKTGKTIPGQQIKDVGGQVPSLAAPCTAVGLPEETALRMLSQTQRLYPVCNLISFHET